MSKALFLVRVVKKSPVVRNEVGDSSAILQVSGDHHQLVCFDIQGLLSMDLIFPVVPLT